MNKRTVEVDFTNAKQPEPEIKRNAKGQFVPGQSGNPLGKPPKRHRVTQEILDLFHGDAAVAIKIIAGIMKDSKVDANTRLKAAEIFFEKYAGRNFQAAEPIPDEPVDQKLIVEIRSASRPSPVFNEDDEDIDAEEDEETEVPELLMFPVSNMSNSQLKEAAQLIGYDYAADGIDDVKELRTALSTRIVEYLKRGE